MPTTTCAPLIDKNGFDDSFLTARLEHKLLDGVCCLRGNRQELLPKAQAAHKKVLQPQAAKHGLADVAERHHLHFSRLHDINGMRIFSRALALRLA